MDVEQFLRRGYLIVQSNVPSDVNEAIFESASEICSHGSRAAARVGDGILDAIPMLHEVLDSPPVQEAVRSVLGDCAMLHGHRHLHISSSREQMWHKDSYWGFRRIRNHRPRWCMVLYYPQETTLDIGPTHVLAGSQYWTLDTEDFGHGEDILVPDDGSVSMFVNGSTEQRAEMLRQAQDGLVSLCYSHLVEPVGLTVPAGSCVLMHYDLFHRAGKRLSDDGPLRCMFKFQYLRTMEPPPLPPPSAPLPEAGVAGAGGDVAPDELEPVLQDIRSWWRGEWLERPPEEAALAEGGDAEAEEGVAELPGPDAGEVERIVAAYRLARRGAAGRSALVRALLRGEAEARAASYGLCAAGPEAMHLLLPLLQHESPRVRCFSAFALSESARPCAELVAAFANALRSEGLPLVEAGFLQALVSVASRARAVEDDELCASCVALALPFMRPVRADCTWRGENACLVVLMAGGRDGAIGREAMEVLMAVWENTCDPYMACFAGEVLRRMQRANPGLLDDIRRDGDFGEDSGAGQDADADDGMAVEGPSGGAAGVPVADGAALCRSCGGEERQSCEKKSRLGCEQPDVHLAPMSR